MTEASINHDFMGCAHVANLDGGSRLEGGRATTNGHRADIWELKPVPNHRN
jgi:hypothetical protein